MLNKNKIIVNLIYISTTFGRNFLAKKMSISTKNSHFEIIILSAILLIFYSKTILYFTDQKQNNYSYLNLFIFNLFFFISTVLLFQNVTKVSALQNGILLQSKSVVIFVLSYFLLKKTFKKYEILGVLLIIFGIVGCKFFDSNENKFLPKESFMLILSGIFSGLAACYFDYTSKDKTNSPIRLMYDVNLLYFLVAFSFFLGKIFVKNEKNQIFTIHVFTLSIFSFFEILAGIYNSYWFTALERLVLGMIVKMISNILIDFLIDHKVCFISLGFYLISTIGIFIYHLRIVKEFFRKEST